MERVHSCVERRGVREVAVLLCVRVLWATFNSLFVHEDARGRIRLKSWFGLRVVWFAERAGGGAVSFLVLAVIGFVV